MTDSMRWPSLPQTAETTGRRQILRSGATALALLGTATPAAGRVDSDQSPAEATSDEFAPVATELAQQQKLVADDGDDADFFGDSVAVSTDGTTAIIGAPGDEDPNGHNGGSAYVYTRSGGEWSYQQKLASGDRDFLGVSIALSSDGTTALIGAPRARTPDGNVNDNAGTAYVFTRSNGDWGQQQRLVANDVDSLDYAGHSVALSSDGTTALVGASGNNEPNGNDSGSAYVFSRTDGQWSQQQKLAADDGDDDDSFGHSVALSGDGTTALIGAIGDDNPDGDKRGSAYVFTVAEDEWSQQQKLTASDADRFSSSVALSNDGTTALIGDDNYDFVSSLEGAAYVFTRSGGEWSRQQQLAADDGEAGNLFGTSVALSNDGTTALIGAKGDNTPNEQTVNRTSLYDGNVGSAYVFTLTDDEWSQQQKLAADDGDDNDQFGNSVALSSNRTTALVGAAYHDDPNGDRAGSAYAFSSSDDDDSDSTLRRFDTNNNGQIDFNEVIDAIAANNAGTQIGGQPVDFNDVLAVIAAHNNGTQV